MTQLEQDDMYSKIKDIHRMVSDIWTSLKQGSPNDDLKDFIINVIANQIGRR